MGEGSRGHLKLPVSPFVATHFVVWQGVVAENGGLVQDLVPVKGVQVQVLSSLRHKPTGRILLTLASQEYEVFVKENDSFGGLKLRLNKTRKRGR